MDFASALPAAPLRATLSNPITGDYRIDALLDSATERWNKGSPLGSPVAGTYSFMSAKPAYGGTDTGTDVGFRPFTEAQKAAARSIFARVAGETGLHFTEVPDTAAAYGQIRLGNNTQQTSAGYAYLPYSSGGDIDGDVWIDDSEMSTLTNVAPGTYAFATLVHEIGHSLGLKHPGNYNAGESASQVPGNYLGASEDNTLYTIMSYRDAGNGLQRDWYGVYDMLALRALYGAGPAGSGDTRYAYDDSVGGRMVTLYDAGGVDTLDLSGTTTTARVDLRAGTFSSVGRSGSVAPADNLAIDFASVIENYVGNAAADKVTGNGVANRFTLGAGTNVADGAAGVDTAVYAAASSQYKVNSQAGAILVVGNGASDTLANIERLEFVDRKLAFDASAQQVAKVIGAVFGPSAVANTTFEGIGLALMDGGMSYAGLVQAALDFRLGAGAANADVVKLLYTNVVGVAPDASTLSTFVGWITGGSFTQASFGQMAADHVLNTTHIDLVGLAASGIAYT